MQMINVLVSDAGSDRILRSKYAYINRQTRYLTYWKSFGAFKNWYELKLRDFPEMDIEMAVDGFTIVPLYGYDMFDGYVPNEVTIIPKRIARTMVDNLDVFGIAYKKTSKSKPYEVILHDLDLGKAKYLGSFDSEIEASLVALEHRLKQMDKVFEKYETQLSKEAKTAYLNNMAELQERIDDNKACMESV